MWNVVVYYICKRQIVSSESCCGFWCESREVGVREHVLYVRVARECRRERSWCARGTGYVLRNVLYVNTGEGSYMSEECDFF